MHSAGLDRRAVTMRHGLRVTSVEQTLLDLAVLFGPRALARSVEQALIRRLTNEHRLLELVDRSTGRRGAARLAQALRAGTRPAFTRSEAERRLLALVRDARLPQPATNVRIGEFEVDALWAGHRLVVEVDGFAAHGTRAAFERDRRRDAELAAPGFTCVRVTWRQVMDTPYAVVATLASALSVRASAPRQFPAAQTAGTPSLVVSR